MFSLLKRTAYRHLNQVQVSKTALEHNHRALQQFHPEAKICHVLKSNEYGHGLKQVAPIFNSFGSPFLVVDSLFEAYELYKLGVRTRILILGYTDPVNFKVKKLPFHVAVFNLELAKVLNHYQPDCSVHIFVDTGMSREGVPLAELRAFMKELKKLSNLTVAGLASHFADSDNPRSTAFVEAQVV